MPYILVVGDKEAEAGTVAPRRRGETLPAVPIDALIAQLTAEAVPGSTS